MVGVETRLIASLRPPSNVNVLLKYEFIRTKSPSFPIIVYETLRTYYGKRNKTYRW